MFDDTSETNDISDTSDTNNPWLKCTWHLYVRPAQTWSSRIGSTFNHG